MPRNDADLDGLMVDAHRAGNHRALVTLYSTAANNRERAGDIEATCFYLTHAYVFALEQGMQKATQIHARLKAYGREH